MTIKNLKILAVIPARGGSKGLPKKNILPLAGKPLIAWSIEQAKNSKYIDKIFVSTDDKEIAEVAKRYGAEVPFLRPPELAKDTSPTTEALIHALDTLQKNFGEKYDIIIEMQPTYYLRSTQDLDKCLEILVHHPKAESIITVVPVDNTSHPDWVAKIDKNGFLIGPRGDQFRRQNLSKVYSYHGVIMASKVSSFKKNRSIYSNYALGYPLINKLKSTDINEKIDFIIAQSLMEYIIKKRIKI